MKNKKCSKCLVEKPLNEFYRLSASKDGRRPDCKACQHVPAKPPTTEERFWANVKIIEGCWEWEASTHTNNGYGRFWADGLHVVAHRYSWELKNGEIPEGLNVCHTCDNPKCVNPKHMFLGTRSDNMLDAVKKGRWGAAKLTKKQVTEIREHLKTKSYSQIAQLYGVTASCIGLIKTGKTWGWFNE